MNGLSSPKANIRFTEIKEPDHGRLLKRPLGRILVDGEFISPSDLEAALARQKNTNELLGEILVGMGVLDRADLDAVLSIQKDLVSVESAINIAAGVRELVGNLLTRAGRITHRQLDQALQEQKRTGEKLGAVLEKFGMAEAAEIDVILAFQEKQGRGKEAPAPLRLGEILVAAKFITRAQLDQALMKQGSTGKKLGEVLVGEGLVQQHQINHGLRIQQKLVSAALVALLSLVSVSGVEAGGGAHGISTGKIMVSATVLPRTSLKVLRQPQELVVRNDDIARGYMEVKSAALIEVSNNSRAGYLLVFEGAGMPFREVYVQGLDSEVRLGPGGGWVPRPEMTKGSVTDLSFRFILADDTKPGTYAWPLAISATPL